MKQFYNLFAIFVWLMASLGGTLFLFYFGQVLFGILNILLAAMAFPYAKKCFCELSKPKE